MGAHAQELKAIARAMVASGKGILAMDESNGTCKSGLKPSVFRPRKDIDKPTAS